MDSRRTGPRATRAAIRGLAVMRRLGMIFDHEAEIEDDGVVFQAVVYSIPAIDGAIVLGVSSQTSE